MNSQITILTDNVGHPMAQVLGKPGVRDIQQFFQAMSAEDVTIFSISMPATAAHDFMLVQVLAFLKREGKTIYITWTDHEPASHLLETIKSLIHN